MWIDTHAHIYLPQFAEDLEKVVQNAIDRQVDKILLPNIDDSSIDSLFSLCDQYPNYFYPMLGLHPCSVRENYKEQLSIIESRLTERTIIAIGEIGLDFYWDKTLIPQQEDAFLIQCKWAEDMNLPIVIHSRESIDRNIELLEENRFNINGVFHCFTGSIEQAQRIIDLGFYLGIGGVLTFKNSGLKQVLQRIPIEHVLLETDAPYLAPVPFRGKRNESSYVVDIGQCLAEVKDMTVKDVAKITTQNAKALFQIKH